MIVIWLKECNANDIAMLDFCAVTQTMLCFVWPLLSSLPVFSVILVPHPTSPLRYKSLSNTHPMMQYVS